MSSLYLEDVRTLLSSRVPRRDAPAGVPQAAVAVLVVPAADDVDLLLIRRAERASDPWSGHMALPGGRKDEDDRDLYCTVVREVHEELGVTLDSSALLGELDDLRPATAPARVMVRPFVFALAQRPALSLSEEVARVRWSASRELAASMGTTEVYHHGLLRTMPCYRLGDDIVWGMTHRILEPLIDQLVRRQSSR